jgi:hypothetical protein
MEVGKIAQNLPLLKTVLKKFQYRLLLIYEKCMIVQINVTIYKFILETQQLYMFRAFLAHPQE